MIPHSHRALHVSPATAVERGVGLPMRSLLAKIITTVNKGRETKGNYSTILHFFLKKNTTPQFKMCEALKET